MVAMSFCTVQKSKHTPSSTRWTGFWTRPKSVLMYWSTKPGFWWSRHKQKRYKSTFDKTCSILVSKGWAIFRKSGISLLYKMTMLPYQHCLWMCSYERLLLLFFNSDLNFSNSCLLPGSFEAWKSDLTSVNQLDVLKHKNTSLWKEAQKRQLAPSRRMSYKIIKKYFFKVTEPSSVNN